MCLSTFFYEFIYCKKYPPQKKKDCINKGTPITHIFSLVFLFLCDSFILSALAHFSIVSLLMILLMLLKCCFENYVIKLV